MMHSTLDNQSVKSIGPVRICVLAALFLCAGAARAQTTFTVSNVNDGGAGSLRQAIMDANATPNLNASTPDRIEFSMGAPGVYTIQPIGQLTSILDQVVIDGETQPGATCGTDISSRSLSVILNGSTAGVADGLRLEAGSAGSTVRGLVIHSFSGAGIALNGSSNNTVECNFIGTDRTGTVDLGNGGVGVGLNNATGNTIGATGLGNGNLIAGNTGDGVHFEPTGDNNFVYGNYLGTNASGTAVIPSFIGVGSNQASGNTIKWNLISGHSLFGIELASVTSSSNIVQNNLIGTDVTGTDNLGNASDGIIISGGSSNQIGGTSSDGNTIAFNGRGVSVTGSGVNNLIRSNSIFQNSGLGIDLNRDGVTPNDADDPDTGPNRLQNFPVITDAQVNASGNLMVTYNVDSDPANTNYSLNLDFFEADAPGQEGQVLLGTDAYLLGEAQTAKQINLGSPAALGIVQGDKITATATNLLGNTSEISAAVEVAYPADLAITKSNSPAATSYEAGETVTYLITVSNLSATNTVTGALVTDNVDAALIPIVWSCATVSGTASCGGGGGGSGLSDTANLGPSSSVVYTVTGVLSTTAVGALSNVATVTAPVSIVDPDATNNTAYEEDIIYPASTAGGGNFFISNSAGSPLAIDAKLADFNGDGNLDAVLVSGFAVTEPNTIYFGNGSGGFTNSGQSLGNSFSDGVDVGDLDGDGDIDIYVANRNGQADHVFINQGGAQAGSPGIFVDTGQAIPPATSQSVDLGDMDGDGDLDAVVTSNGGSDRVMINDGSGFFSVGYQAPAALSSDVDLGDFDGDGDLDVLISGDPVFRLWHNDGTGNFPSITNYGEKIWSSTVGDFDGDGNLDAFMSGPNGVTVNLFSGSSIIGSSHIGGVASLGDLNVGDVDNDGDLDVLASNGTKVWSNDGSGVFTNTGQTFSVGFVRSSELGDLDGDGDIDAVVFNSSNFRTWLNRKPNVTLSANSPSYGEGDGSALFTATLAGPSTADVLVTVSLSGTATGQVASKMAGPDYIYASTGVTIAPGQTTGTFTALLQDDTDFEPDETIILDIAAVNHGIEATPQQATTTILDNDLNVGDKNALIAFYNATDGANWDDNTNWITNPDPSTWYGVTIVAGRVTRLELWYNALSGTVPADISNLDALLVLNLDGNDLTGTILSTISGMSTLEEVSLGDNNFTGTIPDLTGMTSLRALWIYANNLTGTIPVSLTTMATLEHLTLGANPLSAPFPSQLWNMTGLISLNIGGIPIAGPFPSDVTNLINLEDLSIWGMQLTSVPDMSSMTGLRSLNVEGNQLSGLIPGWITSLTNLEWLYLSSNQWTGGLPDFSPLTELRGLYVYNTNVGGSIPVTVGSLSNLLFLELWGNDHTGPIPSELGDLANLRYLILRNNSFGSSLPTELGQLDNLENFEISSSQVTGAVPSSFTGLTSLTGLALNDNGLTDLPDLSGLTNLGWMNVVNNRFTFEDLEPNVGINNFSYDGQLKFGAVATHVVTPGANLTLSFVVGGTANSYQWKLGGISIPGETADSYTITGAGAGDVGVYTLEVTNAIVTATTLVSNDQFVEFSATPEDIAALLDLYNSTNGAGWTNSANWNTPADVSTWYGVVTNGGRVRELNLGGNNLDGPLPASIGNLSGLNVLNLANNSLSGGIPASVFAISTIQLLDLSGNLFAGPVLTAFSSLPALHTLLLSGNQLTDLPNYSTLPSLTSLEVQNNLLTFEHLVPNSGVTGFVYAPQSFTGSPSSSSVGTGGTLALSFEMAGAGNAYQWHLGGSPIAGANASEYLITAATSADQGDYMVEVTNPLLPGLAFQSGLITVSVFDLAVTTVADNTSAGDSECTLREAILNSNTNSDTTSGDCAPGSGLDTIVFNIPGFGPHSIQLSSALPAITDPVVIDGYSQPGASKNVLEIGSGTNASPVIELDGSIAGLTVDGITIDASGSTVRGLAINRFSGSGIMIQSGIKITEFLASFTVADASEQRTLSFGMTAGATDGFDSEEDVLAPPAPPPGSLDGYLTSPSDDFQTDVRNGEDQDVVWGLVYQAGTGTINLSWNPGSFPADGILRLIDISGGATVDVDMRSVAAFSPPAGINELQIVYRAAAPGDGNVIEGNFLGTDVTGNVALGNAVAGVRVDGGSDNRIGGTDAESANLISGNQTAGVSIVRGATRNLVQGNYIGTAKSGTWAMPNLNGVQIQNSNANTVGGGTGSGMGNTVAFNTQSGVSILYANGLPSPVVPTGNSIISNSIFSNGVLGIDLATTSTLGDVDSNDAGDGDSGANNRMNSPVLTELQFTGFSATVTGSLNSTPFADVHVEFFTNDVCSVSGYGEGKHLLGSLELTTGASGDASIFATFGTGGVTGRLLSATATDTDGNTSEFAACITPNLEVTAGLILKIFQEGLGQPQGMVTDETGNVLVADTQTGEIYRYGPDGTAQKSALPLITNMSRPIDLAITTNQILFVSDLNLNAIYRIDLSTIGLGTDIQLYQPTPWLEGLNGPTNMRVGPDGLLYISIVRGTVGEKVIRIDPSIVSPTLGDVVDVVLFSDAVNTNPEEMAWDVAGNMYVPLQLTGQIIRMPAGAPLPVDGSTLDVMFAGLESPNSINFGVDGKIYVTTRSAVRFGDLGSAVLTPYLSGLSGDTFNQLMFDDERLYIADRASGRVILVTAPARQIQATGSLTFEINASGAPTVSDGSDMDAIRNAFGHWENVTTSTVSFVDGGLNGANRLASATDGVNLVTFTDDEFPFPPMVLAIAAKTIEFGTNAGEAEIIDADVVFNPEFLNHDRFRFGTETQAGFFDIESVATHEIGHILGLVHSGDEKATMFFVLQYGKEARSLTADDRAWVSHLYPEPDFTLNSGSITGNLEDGENPGMPLAGALVLARNVVTGESVHAYSDLNGDYLIPGLESGNYEVSIQPLDGDVFGYPMTAANVSAHLQTITTNTDFLEEFYNTAESGDSSVDDPSVSTFVSVNSVASGIDFISNRDLTPPSIVGVFPVDGAVDVESTTEVLLTFSEQIDISTLSLQFLEGGPGGTPVAGSLLLENGGALGILTPAEPLTPSTVYAVSIGSGLADNKGNAQPSPFVSTFTTAAPDAVPATVVDILPLTGATGVFTTAGVTISFSESMEPASLLAPGSFVLSGPGGPVSGVVAVDRELDNKVATFVPDNRLLESTPYTVTLSTAVKDATGSPLASPYSSSFSTVSAAVPLVISVGPEDGADDITVETPVVLNFSEPIAPQSVTSGSFSLAGPEGAVVGIFELLKENTRIVLRPVAPLLFGSTYTITGTQDLRDQSSPSLPLGSVFTSTFQTAPEPLRPSIISATPASAVPGTIVVIGGTGFDPNPDNNVVSFYDGLNQTSIIVVANDATNSSVTTVVPDGATSGPLSVTVGWNTSNSFAFDVVEFAPSTDEAIAKITADSGARDADVSPDGAFAYVTNSNENFVSIIDIVATATVPPPIPVGTTPLKIAINPDGSRAYVTNFESHSVSVIDLTTKTVIATIPVGLNPYGVAVTPDGSRVYVAEFTSKGISVIEADPTAGGFHQVIARVDTDSGNRDVEVSPDGTIAFVTGSSGVTIINIDPATPGYNSVAARVDTDSGARDAEVSPDGTFLFVTTMDGALLVIDISASSPTPYEVIARTSTDAGAREVETSPDGGLIYVTNFEGGTVGVYKLGVSSGGTAATVISTSFTLELIDEFDVGIDPQGTVFAPASNALLVTNSGDSEESVSIISFGLDSDRDGLSDVDEGILGTDPDVSDTDGDGIVDGDDAFPLDPFEQFDVDNDGIGDNADQDDDNNGLADLRELFPTRIESLIGACAVDPGNGKSNKSSKSDKSDKSNKSDKSSKSDKSGKSVSSPNPLDDNLRDALKNVQKTLQLKYWTDATHPDGKDGHKVFDEDKKAVKELQDVIESSTDCGPTVQALIDDIVLMDQMLVDIAISEINCNGSKKCEKELKKALTENEKAQDDLAKGDADKAIDHFKKAWKAALKSLNYSGRIDDISGEESKLDSSLEIAELPEEFSLDANYPNPFNPTTRIRYALPEAAEVSLIVYDVLGRRVRILVSGRQPAGYHLINFNAGDLPSGMYLYRLQAGAFAQVRSFILMK